ncbi:MAG: hypothetical protein GOMPHAMPRED_001740 [Gomphillus americanus]|uniref:Uncharacterized protein n=1 Tax=Gomphillus americanus TaxID=1940652 RepID=A0A8H3FAY4_9LECA|nr:MAG: hypothetical protein GOMPHAMPRED_001740 [Gomphillus americanus]
MRKLDLDNPVVQRILQDDRPIALRKRRRSIINKPMVYEESIQPFRPRSLPKTPSKTKKKVRFSDPGPEIISTTGLTPALRSTSLDAPFGLIERSESQWPITPSRRRVSLPAIKTTWHPNSPVELHFTPIRQILTPRLKRQIARKDLSDEMNKIEDEHKLLDKQEAELRELREEILELRKSKTPADTTFIEDSQLNLPELDKDTSSVPDSLDNSSEDISTSPSICASHDSIGIFIDPDCQMTAEELPEPYIPITIECEPARTNQAIQTESSLSELEDHIAAQVIHLTNARLELEHIFPGETVLPLAPPTNGDCSPLLAAMLSHLQNAQTALRTTKHSLSNVETQRNNIQTNFNNSLVKLDVARESYAELLRGARAGAEKYAQARQHISALETEVQEANSSSEKLKTALNTYRAEVHALESLITRLEEEGKERLEKVKAEMDEAVTDLECIVAAETLGRREAESELDTRALQIRALEGSRRELKDAISEKQAIVRGLEEELDQVKSGRDQEVGSLNVRISVLEEELTSARTDVQRLEKEKVKLTKQLDDKQSHDLKTISHMKDELRKAVRTVEGAVGDWEKQVATDSNSVRIAGLMTPCIDGGRFRDVAMDNVDGAVAVTRGKSRRSRKVDSAIGILDEDLTDG